VLLGPAITVNKDVTTVPNQVTHFEIFGDEPDKLAEFYRSLLGWQIEKAPGVDYWRIQTGPGGLNGGLLCRPIPEPRSWVHYLHTNALDETVDHVLRLGGAVLREKTAVPKTAWYAVVADPEGNIFALWESDPTAMPPPEPDV
jgi:predicted enzyme related to lactoylglutathione lyase